MLGDILGAILREIFWEIIWSLPIKVRIGCLFVLIAFVVLVLGIAALAGDAPA